MAVRCSFKQKPSFQLLLLICFGDQKTVTMMCSVVVTVCICKYAQLCKRVKYRNDQIKGYSVCVLSKSSELSGKSHDNIKNDMVDHRQLPATDNIPHTQFCIKRTDITAGQNQHTTDTNQMLCVYSHMGSHGGHTWKCC